MLYIKLTLHVAVLLQTLLFSNFSYAKIGDCPPILLNNIEYSSHDNYVEAYDLIKNKKLWKTELFMETFSDDVNVFLEADSQLNIACIENVDSKEIVMKDNRNRQFFLDTGTGTIIYKTKNGQVVKGDEISYTYNILQNIKLRLGAFYYLIILLILLSIYHIVRLMRKNK